MGGYERTRNVTQANGFAHKPVVNVAQTLLDPPKHDRQSARAQGFTGDTCDNCGSSRMVNTGTCKSCQECGTTTGCS